MPPLSGETDEVFPVPLNGGGNGEAGGVYITDHPDASIEEFFRLKKGGACSDYRTFFIDALQLLP